MQKEPIVIVSGLPRSGTSMMMKMLEAGGVPVLVDGIREADEDNPKGYYEFERVKQIEEDQDWLPDAEGKAVKMIAALLKHLPQEYTYKVIFMRRKIQEVLASQREMLVRRGEPTDRISDDKMSDLFQRHVKQVEAWLSEQSNFDTLYVSYNDVIENPAMHARTIDTFLGGGLEQEAMIAVVDPELHRQQG